MVRHIRFYGRGGKGVKLASRILSRALFLSGMNVQDSPLYGAERRGAPVVAFPAPRQMPAHLAREPFVVPRLSASLATPLIEAEATSARRTMEGWRVYRPVIEPERCTRCFLCFALCPEGAIQLDADNYPHIDYAHCKGCLVCLTECAPQAISQLREDAA